MNSGIKCVVNFGADVSIWLHQALKGYRDKDGNPLPNAHLIGMFHRICKLLNYGIKPVFVFDGGVPALKRQTMQNRRQRKLEAKDKSEVTRTKLLTNLVRQQLHKQMKKVLPPTQQMEKVISSLRPLALPGKRTASPRKRARESSQSTTDSDDEDEFAKLRKKLEGNESLNTSFVASLFSSESGKQSSASADSSDSDSEEDYRSGRNYSEHFTSITSPNFDSLPLEIQHEILFDMQESRKSNSWGTMHEMPKDLQNFSAFQMDRLVKRRFLQKKIQTVQKEMGERHILVQELDNLAMTNLEAEFARSDPKTKTTEIIGSKERGAVLIRTKTEVNSGSNANKPGTSKGNQEPEVITIDDYVEEWDSDDDPCSIEPGSSAVRTFPSIVPSQSSNNTSAEDAELQMAIALSLEQDNDFPEVQSQPQPEKMNRSHSHEEKIPDKLPSPVKFIGIATPQKPEVQKSQSSFVLPPEFQKGNNSCYKFLGWVGFNENVEAVPLSLSAATSSKSPVKCNPGPSSDVKITQAASTEHSTSTSESDNDNSDFEEVPDEISEQKIVLPPSKLPNPVFIPENGTEINIPAVSIKFDQDFEFKKEDDIFADIFDQPSADAADTQETLEDEAEIIHPLPGKASPMEIANVNEKSEMDKNSVDNMDNGDEFEEDSDFEDVVEEIGKQALNNNSINGTPEFRLEEEGQKLPRTLGTLPSQSTPPPDIRLISAQYMQQQERLNEVQKDLLNTRGNQDRIAASITDQMHLEAQELLSLFGIPFVVSPMEAESQCAFLDTACLTDGTITDDSDVWLFGGQRVYKNFFSQGDKPVQLYQYADIVRHLNLDREKLILLAILTGSDYTTGVDGVGPVLALEILTEFISDTTCAFDSLVKFREWWDSAQEDNEEEASNKFRAKFRKLKLRPGFPSRAVYDAYMEPTLDTSTEPFRWGSPNLISIKEYARKKFGWDDTRCESILGPIMRNLIRIESHGGGGSGRQTTMDNFVNIVGAKCKGKIKSKRLASAMKKLKRAIPNEINLSSDSDSDESDEQSSTRDSGKKNRPAVRNPNPNPRSTKKIDDVAEGSSKAKTPRIPKKTDANIPQRVQAESRNKLLKEQAVKFMKKK